jgi:hypothetical protein
MPETPVSLEDPRLSGKSLFALKRIAEALQAGLLTLDEARRAAARISPHYAGVFDNGLTTTADKAARIVRIIEMILERRFPGRFRASPHL